MNAFLSPEPVPTPLEFLAEIAEEGYGHQPDPDRVPFEELLGSWHCLQMLVQEARLLASGMMATDTDPADLMVREIARRDCLPREELERAEGNLTREDLVVAFRAYREIEGQALELVRAPQMHR